MPRAERFKALAVRKALSVEIAARHRSKTSYRPAPIDADDEETIAAIAQMEREGAEIEGARPTSWNRPSSHRP
jgi:hypothetical protein